MTNLYPYLAGLRKSLGILTQIPFLHTLRLLDLNRLSKMHLDRIYNCLTRSVDIDVQHSRHHLRESVYSTGLNASNRCIACTTVVRDQGCYFGTVFVGIGVASHMSVS